MQVDEIIQEIKICKKNKSPLLATLRSYLEKVKPARKLQKSSQGDKRKPRVILYMQKEERNVSNQEWPRTLNATWSLNKMKIETVF